MDRVRAVAAALAALMLLANCDSSAMQPTSTTDAATTDVTTPSTGITSLPPENCEAVAPLQYDEFGSIHTIVPNEQPIDIEITPARGVWCSGGRGAVDITFTNRGAGSEHLNLPMLLLHGGAAKWALLSLESFDLAPGEQHAVHVEFIVPGAPPGSYTLTVYGFYDVSVPITIDGPDPASMPTPLPPATVFGADSAPCTGFDFSGVALRRDDEMGNERSDIVLTNISGHPCLVFGPPTIAGIDGDGAIEPIETSEGVDFGLLASMPGNVVPTGGDVAMMLGWSVACVDGDYHPQPWSGLRLLFMDGSYVDVSGGEVDTRCGLSISNLGILRP